MAEAAGLVLGAVPLVFLALDKYQDCLEFGRSYAKYTDTLMSIRDEISLQHMQFHGTMEMMGLHKPTYMELEDCLRSYFPENHTTFMRYIRKMAAIISQLMAKLEVDAYGTVSNIDYACRTLLMSSQALRQHFFSSWMGVAASEEKFVDKGTHEAIQRATAFKHQSSIALVKA